MDLAWLDPQPAGFGLCGHCAYRETAPPLICFTCAAREMEALTEAGCITCGLTLREDGSCGNPICSWSDRYFERNYAIAMRSGQIQKAIDRYKYQNVRGWALIFARVLVGFLDRHRTTFRDFDLIVPSPTFISDRPENRNWDHTLLVVQKASDIAEGAWPFDTSEPAAIVKIRETTRMMGKTWRERKGIAENELRGAIALPDSFRINDKHILVYDDVFTDGFTLNEVARCLIRNGGARRVCGISLVRQRLQKKST